MPKPKPLLSLLAVAASFAFPTAAQATLAYVGNAVFHPTVFAARNDGSDARKIGYGFSPHVSPDGRLIAYLDEGPRFEQRLELAPSRGGRHRTLLIGWRESGELVFSPDSRSLLALQGPPIGRLRLVLIDVASGGHRVVARGFFAGFGFSPDGSEFAYARASAAEPPFRSDVFRASVKGGEPVRITHDRRSSHPLWGPTRIVFTRALEAKPRRYGMKSELFLMNRRGRGVERLTQARVPRLHQMLFAVDWSADGSRLLAESQARLGSYATTVDPASGAERPVVDRKSGFVGTALSADGASVLGYTEMLEGPEYVQAVPYEGGDPDVLAGNATAPDWSR